MLFEQLLAAVRQKSKGFHRAEVQQHIVSAIEIRVGVEMTRIVDKSPSPHATITMDSSVAVQVELK